MKATLPKTSTQNGLTPTKKEMINCYDVVVLKKGKLHNPVTARFYMGRSKQASVVYCALWVYGRCSGGGKATGWGYHKPSAALQAAIDSAGIKLSEYIEGRGDDAIETALLAIATAAGYRGQKLIVRN